MHAGIGWMHSLRRGFMGKIQFKAATKMAIQQHVKYRYLSNLIRLNNLPSYT